jgi:HK97 family phage portal protein
MTWIENLRQYASRLIVGGEKGATGVALTPIYGTGGWWAPEGVSQAKLMGVSNPWVQACVFKIAEVISAANLRLYRIKGSERQEWEELDDHEILQLLNMPNSYMPRFELFQLWSMHDDLTGNAYWLLEGMKTERSKPTAIYPLNPSYIKPKVTTLPELVTGYLYENGAQSREFKAFEILHFRRPSAKNPYLGFGPTEAVADSIDADNWAREWMRKFFQNSGRPGLVLETTYTDERKIKLLRETFEDRFSGASKAHKTAILPEGVKIASTGFSQKDMDFVELRRFSRDEILASYGVPAVVLGLGLGETINRASAETLEYVFLKHTIKPKLSRFVTFLNEFFVPLFGADLVLEFDDPVPENTEMLLKEHTAALGGQPYKSINEVRHEEGLPPINGGDNVMGSSLQVPVGVVPQGKVAPKHSEKAQKPSKRVTKADKLNQASDEIAKRVAAAMVKHREELTKMDWAPMHTDFVKRVVPHENALQGAMAKYAMLMKHRALDELKKQSGKGARGRKKAIDVAKLLDVEDEVASIIELVGPIFLDILKEEGTTAARLIGEAFDETDERMRKALDRSMKLLAQKYTEETVALLKERLSAGIEAGAPLDELADGVAEVGEFSETVRAERVAKTEAFRVANFATRSAWQQSDVVSEVKWYTAQDERVCEFCGPMDGKVVGIEQNFFEKGDTVTGSEGGKRKLDYADVENPPLHPNCRCYIRPESITVG